jgi:hypothetical protein
MLCCCDVFDSLSILPALLATATCLQPGHAMSKIRCMRNARLVASICSSGGVCSCLQHVHTLSMYDTQVLALPHQPVVCIRPSSWVSFMSTTGASPSTLISSCGERGCICKCTYGLPGWPALHVWPPCSDEGLRKLNGISLMLVATSLSYPWRPPF